MDKYDPQKKTALVVDEWGGWYDTEPGTNPCFSISAKYDARCRVGGHYPKYF